MSTPEPKITYSAIVARARGLETPWTAQETGSIAQETVLTFHLPQGDIEVRHKGDYLEMRISSQPLIGFESSFPAYGEMHVRVIPQEETP